MNGDERWERAGSERGNAVARVLATVFVIAAMALAVGIFYQVSVDRQAPSVMVKATPAEVGLQETARMKAIESAFREAQVQLNMDVANHLLSGGELSTWTISKTAPVLDEFEVRLTGTCGAGRVAIVVTAGPAWIGYVAEPDLTMHATVCQ